MTSTELRGWRTHWLLTQPQLAAQLGVHLETVSRWERGAVPIPAWLPLALETLARRRAADLAERAATATP